MSKVTYLTENNIFQDVLPYRFHYWLGFFLLRKVCWNWDCTLGSLTLILLTNIKSRTRAFLCSLTTSWEKHSEAVEREGTTDKCHSYCRVSLHS